MRLLLLQEGANEGEGEARDPAMHDRRKTMHRKSSSLHMDASTATGWLAELGEAARGLGEASNGISNGSLCHTAGEGNGRDNQWVSTPRSGGGRTGVERIVVLFNVPFPCGDFKTTVLLRKQSTWY